MIIVVIIIALQNYHFFCSKRIPKGILPFDWSWLLVCSGWGDVVMSLGGVDCIAAISWCHQLSIL